MRSREHGPAENMTTEICKGLGSSQGKRKVWRGDNKTTLLHPRVKYPTETQQTVQGGIFKVRQQCQRWSQRNLGHPWVKLYCAPWKWPDATQKRERGQVRSSSDLTSRSFLRTESPQKTRGMRTLINGSPSAKPLSIVVGLRKPWRQSPTTVPGWRGHNGRLGVLALTAASGPGDMSLQYLSPRVSVVTGCNLCGPGNGPHRSLGNRFRVDPPLTHSPKAQKRIPQDRARGGVCPRPEYRARLKSGDIPP